MALAALLASCRSTRPRVAPVPVPVPEAELPPVEGAVQRGLASWYGAEFANLPTASGEIFRPDEISAAHRSLPLGTLVDVTNEKNGKTVRVKVNDRGPFVAGRIVDLSKGAAAAIGSVADGVVPVTLTVVKPGDGKRVRRVPDEALATTSPTGEWAVQAGAFGSEANAARLKDRLADRYPTPWLEDFQGLKRVKFGPYRSREEADAARASLAELGLAGIVVPYR